MPYVCHCRFLDVVTKTELAPKVSVCFKHLKETSIEGQKVSTRDRMELINVGHRAQRVLVIIGSNNPLSPKFVRFIFFYSRFIRDQIDLLNVGHRARRVLVIIGGTNPVYSKLVRFIFFIQGS